MTIITELWQYPVKSMQGEQIEAALVTERGFFGDRGYALLDLATGHIASAKHPRKWGKLLQCRARYESQPQPGMPLPPVVITLSNGVTLHSNQPDIDQALSRAFDRQVRLIHDVPAAPTREANRADIDDLYTRENIKQEPMGLGAPEGTFFDYGPIHVLTTATLARLQELAPESCFDLRRFRPNIVITPENHPADFVENGWLGKTMVIGERVTLRLVDPTPRCVITTQAQGKLPADLDILRTVARHTSAASVTLVPGHVFMAVVGVYASAVQGGMISMGEMISVM